MMRYYGQVYTYYIIKRKIFQLIFKNSQIIDLWTYIVYNQDPCGLLCFSGNRVIKLALIHFMWVS